MLSCEYVNLERLLNGSDSLSVIGLGYVGLPLAVAFSKKMRVIGYDKNESKVLMLTSGFDPTQEVGSDELKCCSASFTHDDLSLRDARFHIIAVPTPIRADRTPDLSHIEAACVLLGHNLIRGSIVVFESTVYPGVTEEVCVPILEKASKLKCGEEFKVGYSPERINPGDKYHRLENIIKVVSGMDEEAVKVIGDTYESIITAGVYRAESIKVAEAAKVIENSQRDINIAFMNELSIIFDLMGIDTQSVLNAASTKWNFINFKPGLVGGHCIGVDPYYLTYRAEQFGYRSQIILAGRRINDDMGKYVVENLVKHLIEADLPVKNARIAILGLTFKEDCPDTRNTRVVDIIRELKGYKIYPIVVDPVADASEAQQEYGITLTPISEVKGMDAIVVAVAHQFFYGLTCDDLCTLFHISSKAKPVLFDLKGIYDRKECEKAGFSYWRL